MADRVAMRGGDPFTQKGMNMRISFKDRTTAPTDREYNRAVAAVRSNGARKAKGNSNG